MRNSRMIVLFCIYVLRIASSSSSCNLFSCDDGQRCIDYFFRCNNATDCDDGLDEIDCDNSTCPWGYMRCASGQCLYLDMKCNGYEDCNDGSDENGCDSSPCPKHDELSCDGGNKCIRYTKRCNRVTDCDDGIDELACGISTCPWAFFRCKSGQCILLSQRCNNHKDCYDGSDELECETSTCHPGFHRCEGGGQCIPQEWVCDGYKECIDGGDENNCENHTCLGEKFHCPTGHCVDLRSRCNGQGNCPDNSDESNCASCFAGSNFQCTHKLFCLLFETRCDAKDDCGDGSDEANCSMSVCPDTHFRCNSGQCIHSNQACDGNSQCIDGSDEKFTVCKLANFIYITFAALGVFALLLIGVCVNWKQKQQNRIINQIESTTGQASEQPPRSRRSSVSSIYDEIEMYQSTWRNAENIQPSAYTVLNRDPHAYDELYGLQRIAIFMDPSPNRGSQEPEPEDMRHTRTWSSLPSVLHQVRDNVNAKVDQSEYVEMLPTSLQINSNMKEKSVARKGFSKSMSDVIGLSETKKDSI